MGYNSRVFISPDVSVARTYDSCALANPIWSIAARFFADFHPACASPSPLQFVGGEGGGASLPPSLARAPRLASRIDDGTLATLVAVDNSRARYRSYFSAVFAIAKQSSELDKRSAFQREFASGRRVECPLFVVPLSFNESGILSILSPTT